MTYLHLVEDDGSVTELEGSFRDLEFLTHIELNGREYGFLDYYCGRDFDLLVYGAI